MNNTAEGSYFNEIIISSSTTTVTFCPVAVVPSRTDSESITYDNILALISLSFSLALTLLYIHYFLFSLTCSTTPKHLYDVVCCICGSCDQLSWLHLHCACLKNDLHMKTTFNPLREDSTGKQISSQSTDTVIMISFRSFRVNTWKYLQILTIYDTVTPSN